MSPAFFVRRLASALITIWFIATAVFILLRVTNDPIASLASGGETTRQDVEAVRARYGFDRSSLVQYAQFLAETGRTAEARDHLGQADRLAQAALSQAGASWGAIWDEDEEAPHTQAFWNELSARIAGLRQKHGLPAKP